MLGPGYVNARVVTVVAFFDVMHSKQIGLYVCGTGYAGDVWDKQPAPKDHPWRYMPHHAMTPHLSGTTLDAQV